MTQFVIHYKSRCHHNAVWNTMYYKLRCNSTQFVMYYKLRNYYKLQRNRAVIIRPTCRDVLWYGVGVCLSVCPSVHKACRHDTDRTISARTVKLVTHITYDKRKNPIDFLRSWVKGQGHRLHIIVKPCKHDTDWTVSARTVKLGIQITYDKRTTHIDVQGHGSKVKVTR